MEQILVIDDEDAVAGYLMRLITRLGYTCSTVSCAADAFKKLDAEKYPMVIADIHLPDAPDAETWIGALASKCDHVVLISGMPTPELQAIASSHNINTFLSKPFELAFIRKTLETFFGKPA